MHATAERKQENALVDQMLDRRRRRTRLARAAPTLDALWNGQVDTLLVARDARMPGAECPNCGRIVASGRAECPSCSARMEPLDDIIERAIERTLGQSGQVELLGGAAAERLHEAGGGIGAILRYTLNPGEPTRRLPDRRRPGQPSGRLTRGASAGTRRSTAPRAGQRCRAARGRGSPARHGPRHRRLRRW